MHLYDIGYITLNDNNVIGITNKLSPNTFEIDLTNLSTAQCVRYHKDSLNFEIKPNTTLHKQLSTKLNYLFIRSLPNNTTSGLHTFVIYIIGLTGKQVGFLFQEAVQSQVPHLSDQVTLIFDGPGTIYKLLITITITDKDKLANTVLNI